MVPLSLRTKGSWLSRCRNCCPVTSTVAGMDPDSLFALVYGRWRRRRRSSAMARTLDRPPDLPNPCLEGPFGRRGRDDDPFRQLRRDWDGAHLRHARRAQCRDSSASLRDPLPHVRWWTAHSDASGPRRYYVETPIPVTPWRTYQFVAVRAASGRRGRQFPGLSCNHRLCPVSVRGARPVDTSPIPAVSDRRNTVHESAVRAVRA